MIKRFLLKYSDIFFTIVLLELFIGGGGRVISFNNITLRMLLFGLCIIWLIINLLQKRKPGKLELLFTGSFMIITIFSTILGLVNQASTYLIFLDLKQLTFFVSILFLSLYIDSDKKIERIITLIKYSSLILAIGYILTLLLIYLNIFHFDSFYKFLSVPNLYDEFAFRGEKGFYFYKGFFYLSIGFFFFLFDKRSIWNRIFAAIVYIALYLTLLRWLLFTTMFVYLIYIGINFIYNKWKIPYKHIINIVLMGILFLTSHTFYMTSMGDKALSDNMRRIEFQQVCENLTPKTFIIGNGFGIGVAERPVHMEYMYLEILHKQGIIGILFWLFLLGYCCYYFINTYSINDERIIVPFFLSVLVVYVQSITNPFLINPIGMSITIISFISLKYYLSNKKLLNPL